MTTCDHAFDDCWNRIGISGDRSCPELVQHVLCRNCPVFEAGAGVLRSPRRPRAIWKNGRVSLTPPCRRLTAPVKACWSFDCGTSGSRCPSNQSSKSPRLGPSIASRIVPTIRSLASSI